MANRGQLAGFLSIDPERLHESLLTLVLRVSVVLGVIVYIPSVYVSLRVGTYGIALIDTIALLGAFALLHFDRVPFRLRATTICVIYYALGIGLLVSVGSISQIYLFGFSVVTVLLLGLRMGVCAALLSSVSLLGVGASGFAAAGMGIPQWSHNFTEWVVITINFTLVNTLLTLAVGAVLGTINKALKVEVASRLERKLGEAERQRLLAQLQLQIERMPLAYLLCDKDFRYTRWNPAAERMFGFKESDVLGKHPFDLIVPAKSHAFVASIFDAMKAARDPSGIGCIVVIPAGSKPPGRAQRTVIKAALKRLSSNVRGLVWVVEGQGFEGAAVRGVLMGLALFGGAYPTHVSTSTHDALNWLAAKLAPSHVAIADAERAIRDARMGCRPS